MNFHRPLTHAQFIGNDLVGFSGNNEVHHLALTFGQLVDSPGYFGLLITSRAPFLVSLQRLGYPV